MEASTLVQLISGLGLPTVGCVFMYRLIEKFVDYLKKQNEENEAQQKETIKALQEISITMAVFNERLGVIECQINKGGEKNGNSSTD